MATSSTNKLRKIFKKYDNENITSVKLNLEEKRLLQKRFKLNDQNLSWRKRKVAKRALKEEQFLSILEAQQPTSSSETLAASEASCNAGFSDKLSESHGKLCKLSIAVPGSILNNAQTLMLRSYLAGQIARAAAVFCVDEVIVFDDSAQMTEEYRQSYISGSWIGSLTDQCDELECNFQLAKILEYLECPQYLRKVKFPMQHSLKFSGVLNPLDCIHHLREDNVSVPYRDGVILNKPIKAGRGPFCYIGIKKELQLDSEINLPADTRVTVKVHEYTTESKYLKGSLISPAKIRDESGLYWGYKVRVALSLHEVVASKPYDLIIGTSDKGTPFQELPAPLAPTKSNVLIIFGGLKGLETSLKVDKMISSSDPVEFFDYYVNTVPDQGSRTIRTEEAILISLAVLKTMLN